MSARPPTRALTLLHVDHELVAIDKPPRMLAAPGRGPELCAVDVLRARPELQDNPAVRIVHRLDQDASGVLLYARTLEAQRHLVRQFVERRVHKAYLALVGGVVPADGEIDLPLAFDRRHNRVRVSSGAGKHALTRYRVVQRLAGHTLLECQPVTGRLHQIRAHLAAIGHPLAVDPLYGGGQSLLLSHYKIDYRPNRRRPEHPLIARLTLHAARITFEHPATGQPLTLAAPWPKDLRAAVTQLSRLL
jgi:RluA family pseudouridine synthase